MMNKRSMTPQVLTWRIMKLTLRCQLPLQAQKASTPLQEQYQNGGLPRFRRNTSQKMGVTMPLLMLRSLQTGSRAPLQQLTM